MRVLRLVAVAALAAASVAVAGSGPAAAATRSAARSVPPPVYRWVPPVYVPPVDYRAPVAAEIDADRAIAESTRDQVDAALAANAAEQIRVTLGPRDEAGSARLQASQVRDVAKALGRLGEVRGALEGARAGVDSAVRRAHDLAGSLYARPVADGAADAAQLNSDLGPAVSIALQTVFDEARTELGDVYGTGLGAPRFSWPEQSFEISQGFGPSDLMGEPPFAGYDHFHLGIDLAAPAGTPVKSAADGVVVLTGAPTAFGRYMGFGNYVLVAHGGQIDTLYGHLDEVHVHAGDIVRRGQTLGFEGSTGYSTGPHLHFETHHAGEPVDPAPYLPGR